MPCLISDVSYLNFFLSQSMYRFVNLVDLFKEFWFHWFFSIIFPFSTLFISALIFIISFLLLVLVGFSFSSSLKSKLGYWFEISFFNVDIYCYKFPSEHYFSGSHKFWYVFCFLFVSRYFLISFVISSLIHCLFKHMFFSVHIFVDFPVFLLLLISSFFPLWPEKKLYMILIWCWD